MVKRNFRRINSDINVIYAYNYIPLIFDIEPVAPFTYC